MGTTNPLTRRDFLSRTSAQAAGWTFAATALSAASYRRVLGANERIRMALIGCGGRGVGVLGLMMDQGADVTWVCDVHPDRRAQAARSVADKVGHPPKATAHLRDVLDSPDVDAVLIATPDHWHALATIQACRAGKDVYVEKPHSHNLWESRMMIRAARKYNRIVQVGTQNRSGPYNQAAKAYIDSGKLGSIHLVKVYNLKSGGPFHLGEPGTEPDGLEWHQWLGPAAIRPYHQGLIHYGWLHFWDFSSGDLGGDGIHQLDLARMLMGDPPAPKSAVSSGGRLAHKGDDSQMPDLLAVSYEFDDFVMTLDQSNYPRYMQKTTTTIRRNDLLPYWTQNSTRIELYGSELLMIVGRHGGGWVAMTSGGRIVDQMYGRPCDEAHIADFFECIKTRRRPTADIETLHASDTLVHMANIAHRVGNRKLWYDATAERFIDDDAANALVKRQYREGFEPEV